MKQGIKYILAAASVFFFTFEAYSQKVDLNGQFAGWLTVSHSDNTYIQPGLRFVPQLTFSVPVSAKFKFDCELSADGFYNYTSISDTAGYGYRKARLYRAWLRFSGDRFEIRAGLQKINFGSANILRPLMWFDRVDPRDPLKLTTGVYGLLGKYYFRNNANIWVWSLLGNKETTGWETVPSSQWRPEFGGRIQLPIPKGEIAFSYHNREARFADGSQPAIDGNRYFNENRYAIDAKADLGIGLWIEGSITHRTGRYLPEFEKAVTAGADYTIGLGQGLNIIAENMFVSTSQSIAATSNSINMTGLSVSLPLSIITRATVIIFYDWKDNGWYNFANLSFTFNKTSINIIGFDNPESFSLLNFSAGRNIFAGYGGQVMMVYNF
ncbi:MAG TPA: hypothetical protein VMT63_05220 [Bacteroidales bacterium]|nr:hypothetical protein [Bacteroidales bacterium]